jgi:hypothetical protein
MRKGLNEKRVSTKKHGNEATAAAATTNTADGQQPGTSRDLDTKSDYESIVAVISDCEPAYIHRLLAEHAEHPNRVEFIINKMLETKSYPRLRDALEKEKKQKNLDAHINMELDFDEFLKVYPAPHVYFYDKTKPVSDNYKNHCRTLLFNNFLLIARESLEKVLSSHNWHLTPAFRQLEDAYPSKKQVELKERIARNQLPPLPHGANMYFHQRRVNVCKKHIFSVTII